MKGSGRPRALIGLFCVSVAAALVCGCKKDLEPATPRPAWSEPDHPLPKSGAEPGGSYGAEQPAAETPSRPPGDLENASPDSVGGAGFARRALAFDDLVEDFAVAESAFLQSTGACTDACRALRSMQRAAERLCALAANGPERERCETARHRVRAAVDLVRSMCQTCHGNPPLDDD